MARFSFLPTLMLPVGAVADAAVAPQRPDFFPHTVVLAHQGKTTETIMHQQLIMRQMMRHLAHHRGQSLPLSADGRTPALAQRVTHDGLAHQGKNDRNAYVTATADWHAASLAGGFKTYRVFAGRDAGAFPTAGRGPVR